MYTHAGQDLFVIDGHTHLWDASPENWRTKHGESWIRCFYAFHSALSPAEVVWPFEKFCHYGAATLVDDLFRTGYVDMGILNSTYLYEFYKNGFNSHVQNNTIKAQYPERFLLCGSFDPRDEEAGLDAFRQMVAEYPIQGLKLYTAEWRNGSRGWRLNDPWAYKYFALCQELGIRNIHVHKGPTWTTFAGSQRRNRTSTPGCRWRWPLSICARNILVRSWRTCCSGSVRTGSASAATTPSGPPGG